MAELKKVEALGLALVLLSSVLLVATTTQMPTTWVVLAKEKKDKEGGSGGSTGGSDGGTSDKGDSSDKKINDPKHPRKEDTRDIDDDPAKNGAHPMPYKGPEPTPSPIDKDKKKEEPGKVGIEPWYMPGWKGPIPGEKTKPQPGHDTHRPPTALHLPPIVLKIVEIHETVHHHSGNGGGGQTGAGVHTLTAQEYSILQMVWQAGIKRGQYPEVDKIVDECLGIKA